MSRVQLALNVNDLESAIAFYSKLFGTQPAKVREGYANFAIAEPPLKLVLIENPGEGGSLNHLGVEVESTEQVRDAIVRLQAEGMVTDVEEQTNCCYALQDKVWVHDPAGTPWEVYVVKDDNPAAARPATAPLELVDSNGDAPCCTPHTSLHPAATSLES